MSTTDAALVHDVVAERMVIAATLSGHPQAAGRFMQLPHDAFYVPMHDAVAHLLRDRIARKVPLNALSLAADAEASATNEEMAYRVRAFVLEAGTNPPGIDTLGYYLEQVRTCAAIRTTAGDAVRLVQRLGSVSNDAELGEVVGLAMTSLEQVRDRLAPAASEPPMSLGALLDREMAPYDWLVPDLLERGDRLVLTGYEGTGKSMILAQMALTMAAGLHPFTGYLNDHQPDGYRVLVLDCENGVRQVQRRWRLIRDRVAGMRTSYGVPDIDWYEQVRLEIRPEGIDLANVQEFARIEQIIALTAPDIVVGGPIYKMSKLDIRDEPAAKALIDALDYLRVKYNFTLILEAHVGHVGETSGGRKLRPTGSSALLRWPEFGYGFRAHPEAMNEEHPSLVEMVAWRGSRDERRWPTLLTHSKFELPWTPRDPKYRRDMGMPEWRSEQLRPVAEGA